MNSFITKNLNYIVMALCIATLLGQCSSCRTTNKLEKTNKELVLTVDSLQKTQVTLVNGQITTEEIREQMDQSMYNFLIYEDDLDKGKVSMSAIKNKIDK